MSLSNWKKCKLANICSFSNGKKPAFDKLGKYPVYGANGKYGISKKYNADKGNIVIGRVGAYCGSLYFLKEESWITDNAILAIPKINSRFLFYFLLTCNLNHLSQGAAQPLLNQTILNNIDMNLPPIEEQKRIAGVLGAFDDKIELLQKQNKTLENMAKAIFKSWFVDFDVVHAKQQGQPKAAVMQQYHLTEELYNLFPSSFEPSSLGPIPTGWQVKPLSQIATFLNGLALQKYPANDNINYLPVIKIAELRNGLSTSSDRASCDIPAEYIVYNGDILFSWSGSLMVKIWPGKKGALNQHLFKVSSLEYPKWFYYMWIKYQLPFFQEIAADKATTMGHIQRKHLDQALVCIPKNLNIYTRYFASLIDKQILNNKQIQTLTEMRDALLPRLISGKIRV